LSLEGEYASDLLNRLVSFSSRITQDIAESKKHEQRQKRVDETRAGTQENKEDEGTEQGNVFAVKQYESNKPQCARNRWQKVSFSLSDLLATSPLPSPYPRTDKRQNESFCCSSFHAFFADEETWTDKQTAEDSRLNSA
jgi:hypothetical protein